MTDPYCPQTNVSRASLYQFSSCLKEGIPGDACLKVDVCYMTDGLVNSRQITNTRQYAEHFSRYTL